MGLLELIDELQKLLSEHPDAQVEVSMTDGNGTIAESCENVNYDEETNKVVLS